MMNSNHMQTPVKYMKCSTLEEAEDLAALDSSALLDGASVNASSGAHSAYEESLEARLAESHKRHRFDEVVTQLRVLILRGSRIEVDAMGRRVEVLEVTSRDTVRPPPSEHVGGKRKKPEGTPAAQLLPMLPNETFRQIYYAVDIGFQRQVQQATEPESRRVAARDLMVEEFQHVSPSLGAFLDLPFTVSDPVPPDAFSRGVRLPLSEGIAVDEVFGEYFDDYKDLDLDEDDQSIDYSSSSSPGHNWSDDE
eukprot:Blabericola_migrator_1__1811@NODE_1490_length_4432_cov_90_837801_g569_i3_p3_GENE_NODE_1490_length_4432_cov_90_837801_g569_i3NODE_1490_length_4432_cov_90_837801_g569_i3_p3_ORF_typecomplete_len251_score40_53_NODE_1490_length_4432_cov_90_837801_g569_i324063158